MAKRITLIYPFAYGYIDFVVNELQSYSDIIVTDIKTDSIKYKYPNFGSKIWNGITKIFGKNIKKEFFRNQILEKINEKQDIIFIIRPDLIEDSLLKKLKEKTSCFIAYYYDSCKKYPRQADIANIFDEIYSYEKEDIEKYGFTETTNFIYDEQIESEEIKYDIFNISSFDSRINKIEKISKQLSENGLKIKFIIFWFEKLNYPHLTCTTQYLSLVETKKLISQSKAIIDIQRDDQKGLSFRTFESLGYRKKLITTNSLIKNYDFYDSNNILVINSENLDIETLKNFLERPYTEISRVILDQYTVGTFVKKIFKITD
ncbi:hypothetical protein [Epilithonimonas sp.]|uniref:hypothetical protein n=1 Tax=Epilithonimonas sp. TaxID=2894511 RepID=UPI00289E564F|nr:hypothetical protein [Epilithonimonas sp.]